MEERTLRNRIIGFIVVLVVDILLVAAIVWVVTNL